MDDRSFEDLIGDLLAGQSPAYVSTRAGTYHRYYSCCSKRMTKGKVRRVPLELVKWLGYDPCNECKRDE